MQRSTGGESVGLDYWMKWQVPVCGLIILIPATVSLNLIITRSSSSLIKNDDMWVPCWRSLNPKWLLLYRALAFLTMAWFLHQMLLFAGLYAFYFYTQWTFTLVLLYFAVGTLISARGCFMSSHKPQSRSNGNHIHVQPIIYNGVTKSQLPGGETKEGTPFLASLLLIIYQTCAGASILTDLVFWCILMPMMHGKEFELTFVIGCIHSLNAVFLLIDSLLNALPFPWFGFNYFVLWTVAYAIFQWVLHACGFTWWPYPFLELSTPWAPLWYLGIALVHVPCYGLYVLLVKAKNSIFSKLFPQSFIRSHGGQSDHNKAA